MSKINKSHLFFILIFCVFSLNYFSRDQVYADGSVDTKGVIQLYDEAETNSPSESDVEKSTIVSKSSGKSTLPNTGDTDMYHLRVCGIILSSSTIMLVFFYRIKRKEDN